MESTLKWKKITFGTFAILCDTVLTLNTTTLNSEMRKKKMSRVRNEQVIDAWTRGVKADSHTCALRTDCVNLYSYNLRIGYRARSGTTVVGDFTSPGGDFRSMTTSQHVGKVRWRADHVMHPTVFENSAFPGFNV